MGNIEKFTQPFIFIHSQLIRIIQGIHDDRYGMVLTQGNKERKEKGKYENGNSPKKQKYF